MPAAPQRIRQDMAIGRNTSAVGECEIVAVDSDVAFSQSVPLIQPGPAWMPQQTVGGPLAFSPAANAIKGAFAYVRLMADGVNTPTFPGFTEEIGSAGYDNRSGIVNRLQFSYDGADYWVAISQAANASPAATALTLSLSSASVVSGYPVTATVGTNYPLTGAQSESVTLTAPVAGSWSTNPVTLNASSSTATSTFTPSATGSGNITAAATGTPTVSGASAALTVTAAPTVPGAPTIGTATAGDTTASFAFSAPASNGGATITGYTLSVYNASTNALVGTFTGASSPIAATGLTNGTGYYGKVAATNSVGTGSQSAASNTVTPAAASYPQMGTLLREAASGTGPYTYTGSGAGGFGSSEGDSVCTKALQSGVDGELVIKILTAGVVGGNEVLFGLDSSSANMGYASVDYAGVGHTDSGYGFFANGANAGTVAGTLGAVNDYQRIKRVGSTLTFDVSKDSGNSWNTLKTWTGVSTGVMYFHGIVTFSGSFTVISSSGLA